MLNGWLNIYKPRGVSSAKLVGYIKKILSHNSTKAKIGHTGTLDPEAEGILPLAIGEATKLTNILIDSKKTYQFKIQFGTKTDSGDIAGNVVEQTAYTPSRSECENVVKKFIGEITQTPPIYSAIKIDGVRAYKKARNNENFAIPSRKIHIYDLKFVNYDPENRCASFIAICSKGTYIRTLAEDIALSLQSLGFVIELRREQVGIFTTKNAVNIDDLDNIALHDAKQYLLQLMSRIDTVLDDIPVLDVDDTTYYKVRCGQEVLLEYENIDLLWLRYSGNLLAIGKVVQGRFFSSRVFNILK
jgi:tRNA pseudouridine55 synthase